MHDIQSDIKDPDRFDKWVELLQERVDYDDPIVLPFGESLNIVRRRSDGELVIRTDGGADLCRWDENWKMHTVMFVRDTDELYREIYPKYGHPDGEWQELREYYDPESGPAAGDRGRAVRATRRARVPARPRGLLQGLARARAAGVSARLDGRRAYVTGAGRGLGFAIASRLSELGASVALTDVDEAGVQAAAGRIGGKAIGLRADVTSEEEVRASLEEAASHLGGLDIVVNNAGVETAKPIVETESEEFRRLLDINVVGVFHGIKHAVPHLSEGGGGVIVNMASVAGLGGSPLLGCLLRVEGRGDAAHRGGGHRAPRRRDPGVLGVPGLRRHADGGAPRRAPCRR